MQMAVNAMYAPQSLQSTLAEPGRTLLTSVETGWRSLLVQLVEAPGSMESFQTVATPDHLIVLVLKGVYNIESASERYSSKAKYHPGRGGMTAPMNTSCLRWHSRHKTIQTLHLYLPHRFFEEAQSEQHRHGLERTGLPDVLGFEDPAVFAVAASLAEQAKLGAPEIYAESAARFLAAHLLSAPGQHTSRQTGFAISDRRLQRVLEYIQHHFLSDVTVEDLAREAAISPYHFARLFRAKVGVSPARYIVDMRLAHARFLLKDSDIPVCDVAHACGYSHPGHFAAAFKKQFGVTPLTFRLTR